LYSNGNTDRGVLQNLGKAEIVLVLAPISVRITAYTEEMHMHTHVYTLTHTHTHTHTHTQPDSFS
jgi:hypothetical protein